MTEHSVCCVLSQVILYSVFCGHGPESEPEVDGGGGQLGGRDPPAQEGHVAEGRRWPGRSQPASPPRQLLCPEDEDPNLDEYDLYSLAHSYLGGRARKGRTKREAAANTNRPSPGGHERKLVTKIQNTERKKRAART
uniref:Nuclear protein 1, transcriptional regulator n=1 Tax=Sus scrofa TaxID=9823 RepID=A0A8D1T4F7_PIG